MAQALASLSELQEADGGVFNIGSDEEITINELAELVKSTTHSESPIVHISYEEAYGKNFEDMNRRVPDLSRIRTLIGYTPTKTVIEIVQSVAESLGCPSEKYQAAYA